MFLIEGTPGSGKTTIATQFLIAGAKDGERCLYITLSETDKELRTGARAHGWDLAGIDIFELVPPETFLDEDQQQSLLYSSDLELGETIKRIFEAFERMKPDAVVFDSLSEIRLLAQSSLRYRRQILALKHFFATRKCTVLMLDDSTAEPSDKTSTASRTASSASSKCAANTARERRRLRVVKNPRTAIPRRLPRLHDRYRRGHGVSATGRGRTSAGESTRASADRSAELDRAARRRRGARRPIRWCSALPASARRPDR